jgi:hypothetical protein
MITNAGMQTAGWCNGNTTDFGSVIHGSSPCPVAFLDLLAMIGPQTLAANSDPVTFVHSDQSIRQIE